MSLISAGSISLDSTFNLRGLTVKIHVVIQIFSFCTVILHRDFENTLIQKIVIYIKIKIYSI
jgi:hypothetical protein